MKKTIGYKHLCGNIRGILNYYRRKSMAGLFTCNGRYMSDMEARNYLMDHIEKGHKVLPMCMKMSVPISTTTVVVVPGTMFTTTMITAKK